MVPPGSGGSEDEMLSSFPLNSIFSSSEQPSKPIIVDDEEEYIVEAIQDHKRKHRKLYFLVKWKGYSMDEWT